MMPANKKTSTKFFQLVGLVILIIIGIISLVSLQKSQPSQPKAQDTSECRSNIKLNILDMAGKTFTNFSSLSWGLDNTILKTINKFSPTADLNVTIQDDRSQNRKLIFDQSEFAIVAAKLDESVIDSTENSVSFSSFCGKKTLTILAQPQPKIEFASNAAAQSSAQSCNTRCDVKEQNCPDDFVCVSSCLSGKACPKTFQGVCRAAACPKSLSCGCLPPPTPTALQPLTHGVKGKIRFTGGVQPRRYIRFFFRRAGTEDDGSEYQSLSKYKISPNGVDFQFNPHERFSSGWRDFVIYSRKDFLNSDGDIIEQFPKGTKIIYNGPCKSSSRPDECELNLPSDGGVINLDITINFPPIDESKTGELAIGGKIGGSTENLAGRYLKFTACRVDPIDNTCLDPINSQKSLFALIPPNGQSTILSSPVSLTPGKYLITTETDSYSEYWGGNAIPLPDQTGINPLEGKCDEYDTDLRHCYRWVRDGYSSQADFYFLFPSEDRGVIKGEILINGYLPIKGYVAEVKLCKWSLSKIIGDCLPPFQTLTFRYSGYQHLVIPDIPQGRYVASMSKYYFEEDRTISSKPIPYPVGTRYSLLSNIYPPYRLPFSDDQTIIDVGKGGQWYSDVAFRITLSETGWSLPMALQMDSRLNFSAEDDNWGPMFDACLIVNNQPDCSQKYSAMFMVSGILENLPLHFYINEDFSRLPQGQFLLTPRKGLYDSAGKMLIDPYMKIIRENCSEPYGELGCIISSVEKYQPQMPGPLYKFDFRVPSHIKGTLQIRNTTGVNLDINDVDFNICRNDRDSKECYLAKSKPGNTLNLTKKSRNLFEVNFNIKDGATSAITTGNSYGIQSIIKIAGRPAPLTIFHQYISAPQDNLQLVTNITDLNLDPAQKVTKKVLLLKQNPYLPLLHKRLFEVFYTYVDQNKLANDAISYLNKSIPVATYELTKIIDYDHMPPAKDIGGTTTQEQDYIACTQHVSADNPGCTRLSSRTIDYIKLFDEPELKICDLVNDNKIDEVWNMALPFTGVGEGDMVGPNPYNVNGLVVKNTKCNRNVPILGIDITRAPELAIHSLGHRMESTMTLVYHSLKWDYPPTNNWEKYVIAKSHAVQGAKIFGCGSVHAPPNAVKGYDYLLSNEVDSYCQSFFDYPVINENNFVKVNSLTWGQTEAGYYQWWFSHIPSVVGRGADGVLQNWWTYFLDPDFTAKEAGVTSVAEFNKAARSQVHSRYLNKGE